MACMESFCWTVSLSPPDFPPPPPLPLTVHEALKVANVSDTCDLCSSWADGSGLSGVQSGDNFNLVLSIVAIISALSGAGIMAGILSFKRLRNRKFQNATGSVRHLERKCNEQSLPLPPSRSTNSTPMTNTYCEGPYSDKENYPSNIYAELQTGPSEMIWRRPPIPTPVDSCYLELKGLPGQGLGDGITETQLCLSDSCTYSPSTNSTTPTATYYTDYELKLRELQ